MFSNLQNNSVAKYVTVVLSSIVYALGICVFITPLGLYSGGLMGASQLMKYLLVDSTGLFSGIPFDLTGILYYAVNIPLLILAFKKIGKIFFIKTLLAITCISICMSLFTLSGAPIIDDTLTSCIIGGILSGIGVGFTLRAGGSGGGLDIVGIYFTKKYMNASVGKVSISFNFIIYSICAIVFNIEVAIYSIIFSVVSSVAVDRVHYQNIMLQVMIFTKVNNVAPSIMSRLRRGVTEWQGDGAYTHESTHILVTAISKYEMNSLRKIVLEKDPHAFIIYNHANAIDGNFQKYL